MEVLSVLTIVLKILDGTLAVGQAVKQKEASQKNLAASKRSEGRETIKLVFDTINTKIAVDSFVRDTIDYTDNLFSGQDKEYTRRILRGHTKDDAFGYFLLWLQMDNFRDITLDCNQAIEIANYINYIDTNLIWNSYLDKTPENAVTQVLNDIQKIKWVQFDYMFISSRVKDVRSLKQDNYIEEFEVLDSITSFIKSNQKYLDLINISDINTELIGLLVAKVTFHKYGLSLDSDIITLKNYIIQKEVIEWNFNDHGSKALSSIICNLSKDSLFDFIFFIENFCKKSFDFKYMSMFSFHFNISFSKESLLGIPQLSTMQDYLENRFKTFKIPLEDKISFINNNLSYLPKDNQILLSLLSKE